MPLKIIPPRAGKTPYFSVRGTYLGTYVDRSTKARDRATAAKFLKLWKEEIEQGTFRRAGSKTFYDCIVSYMAATGEERFLVPLTKHFGAMAPEAITQEDIDAAAIQLYPKAAPATRNRQVYTPISAILKQAGIKAPLRRPKGSRGSMRTDWLKPQQAFRIFAAAKAIDLEFAIFLIFLIYTGVRLSDALQLKNDALELHEEFAYVGKTKNGDPRGVYLPPVLVKALKQHPRGLERAGRKVFRFTKCGRLYTLLDKVRQATGPDVAFFTFHTACHTWATWMRRYAGVDTRGLIATGRWRDAASVRRYEHVIVEEESRKAANLPVENSSKTKSKNHRRSRPKAS